MEGEVTVGGDGDALGVYSVESTLAWVWSVSTMPPME